MAPRRPAPSVLFMVATAMAAVAVLLTSPCHAFSPPARAAALPRRDAAAAPWCGLTSGPVCAQVGLQSAALFPSSVVGPLRMSSSDDDSDGEGGGFLSSVSTPLDNPFLAILDLLSFLLFAGIGRASHAPDGSLDLAAIFLTALPFLASWFLTAPLLGCYDPQSTARGVGSAVKVAAKGWIVAVPLGCVGRGLIKGYVPPAPFVIVTMISTLVILAAARAGYSKIQTEIFS